jgi:hypothetical protein
MSFLDDLLAGGPDYRVRQMPDGASFQPSDASDEALAAFQSVVAQIRANEGDGYDIFQMHRSSDRGGNMVDRILITIDDDQRPLIA